MSSRNDSFRHESLHDGKSIKAIVKSIEKGLGDGEISLEDEDGRLVLTPKGYCA
jgi:amphi-Trp domain-containing protein